MSDDAGRGSRGGVPAHGSAGPVDPTADPVTDPGMRIPVTADPSTGPVALPSGPSGPAARHRPGRAELARRAACGSA